MKVGDGGKDDPRPVVGLTVQLLQHTYICTLVQAKKEVKFPNVHNLAT